jgi:hypothetical protein
MGSRVKWRVDFKFVPTQFLIGVAYYPMPYYPLDGVLRLSIPFFYIEVSKITPPRGTA